MVPAGRLAAKAPRQPLLPSCPLPKGTGGDQPQLQVAVVGTSSPAAVAAEGLGRRRSTSPPTACRSRLPRPAQPVRSRLRPEARRPVPHSRPIATRPARQRAPSSSTSTPTPAGARRRRRGREEGIPQQSSPPSSPRTGCTGRNQVLVPEAGTGGGEGPRQLALPGPGRTCRLPAAFAPAPRGVRPKRSPADRPSVTPR